MPCNTCDLSTKKTGRRAQVFSGLKRADRPTEHPASWAARSPSTLSTAHRRGKVDPRGVSTGESREDPPMPNQVPSLAERARRGGLALAERETPEQRRTRTAPARAASIRSKKRS